MDPILFEWKFIVIRYYGLMYALAFVMGMFVAKKMCEKRGIDKKIIEDYAFTAMFSGLLGGRLYYVIFTFTENYLGHPFWKIFAVWEGGMAIHGGIIGGAIGTIIFAKIKKINLMDLLDIGAVNIMLGQAIGRIGNFMNGEIHGVPVMTPWKIIFSNGKFAEWWKMYLGLPEDEKIKFQNLVPWGVKFLDSSPAGQEFPGYKVHPAMLYELVLNLISFFILLYIFNKKKNIPKGYVAFVYLIMYSVIRIFVSFFRAEDIMFMGFRLPHVVGVITIIFALIMIFILNRSSESKF